jgi:hypothetical protein
MWSQCNITIPYSTAQAQVLNHSSTTCILQASIVPTQRPRSRSQWFFHDFQVQGRNHPLMTLILFPWPQAQGFQLLFNDHKLKAYNYSSSDPRWNNFILSIALCKGMPIYTSITSQRESDAFKCVPRKKLYQLSILTVFRPSNSTVQPYKTFKKNLPRRRITFPFQNHQETTTRQYLHELTNHLST